MAPRIAPFLFAMTTMLLPFSIGTAAPISQAQPNQSDAVQPPQGAGAISGTLVDQSGAVIAGSKVVAVNAATRRSYSGRSNKEGQYRIDNLPTGSYDLTVDDPPLLTQAMRGVVVAPGSATEADFTLLAATESTAPTVAVGAKTTASGKPGRQLSGLAAGPLTTGQGVHEIAERAVALDSPAGLTASTQYLQSASDRFQHSVDVYSIADAAGNHFAARGELDANNGLLVQVPAMDEISLNAPCMNITCITATYDPNTNAWGGWYFLNGVLGPTERVPSANWGAIADAGYSDLTGATALQFWARGSVGGEKVQFFAFGVGNTVTPFQPYPDSAPKTTTLTSPTTLSTTWTQYQIPITGLDLSYVLGGFGWVAAKADQSNQVTPITFYLDDIQYVKDRTSEPRLLVSYETLKSAGCPSPTCFDTVMRNAAFTYDNALGVIALAAAGDVTRAQYTADALLYGQGNDRFFTDNRLRNAYQGGDIALPPGWLPNNKANTVRMPGWYDPGRTTWFEDATQVSTNTGNIAWALIADLYLFDITQQQKYLQSAQLLGDWVINNTSPAIGVGFTGGYDGWENEAASGTAIGCASGDIVNGQCKRHYKATEHNIDLYSAFSHLYTIDPSAKWASAAQQAKAFVLSMWDSSEGKFWTGTVEDEQTVSKTVVPLDIQVWSLEALGTENQSFLASLAYIESTHKTTNGYGFKQNGDNQPCNDRAWFEGTSQVALAYELTGNSERAQQIIDVIHSFQNATGSVPATDGNANDASDGYGCVNTGFTLNDGSPWLYYPRPHVGATAWLSIAESSTNPFRADLYSPSLSPSSLVFGKQNTTTTSGSQAITITNKGTAAFSIATAALSGPNSGDFSVLSNSCEASIPVGSSCTINVVFSPQGIGARAGSVTVTEAQTGSLPALSLTPIALSGTGCEMVSTSSRLVENQRHTFFATFFWLPLLTCFGQLRRRKALVFMTMLLLALCLTQVGCGGDNSNSTTTPTLVQKCG